MSTLKRPSEIVTIEKALKIAAQRRTAEERKCAATKKCAVEQEIIDYAEGKISWKCLSIDAMHRIHKEQEKRCVIIPEKGKDDTRILERIWSLIVLPALAGIGSAFLISNIVS